MATLRHQPSAHGGGASMMMGSAAATIQPQRSSVPSGLNSSSAANQNNINNSAVHHYHSHAATSSSLVSCGICFGLLQDPVTLECGDSFCYSCLRSHLERHGSGMVADDGQPAQLDGFLCFLCLSQNPNVNAANLTHYRNPDLAAKVREVAHGKDDAVTCDWCDEAAATLFCGSCNYSLCSDCNTAVHKNSAKRSHTTVSLQDGRRPQQSFRKCSQKGHEEFRAEFFCVKCQMTCCVYCLQTGVHRGHDNITVVDAAADVRQQLSRQVDEVLQVKARVDTTVSELNRVSQVYEETYDQAEQQLTDRFAMYQHQLLKKEAEARELLQQYRVNGDRTIAECRRETLQNMDRVNEAIARGRRLQASGSDTEVLENRIVLNVFQRLEVPTIAGTGFRFADPGDLNLTGIGVSLDVRKLVPNAPQPVSSGDASMTGGYSVGGGAMRQTPPAPPQMTQYPAGGTRSASSAYDPNAQQPASASSVRRRKQPVLTFPQDKEIESRDIADGTMFRCAESSTVQVGVRAMEHFVDGVNTWKVRLDRMPDGALGVMCAGGTNEVPAGEGFFWRPGRQTYEGNLGTPSDLVVKHPPCQPGDILKLTFDADKRQLRVAHNGIERGVLLSNVPGFVSPCFMFNPGETMTLLQ
eukprot:PhM_4_TR4158/c0_g1_i2/m.73933